MANRKQDLIDIWQMNIAKYSIPTDVQKKLLKVTGRGGQSAARDYIHANAIVAEYGKVSNESITDFETMWNTIPAANRFRLKMYTPCLAARYDELKPAQQADLFNNSDWIATEKCNGVRGVLIVYHGKCYLFSRNYSDVDCGLPEYAANIYQDINFDSQDIFAVDVEVMFEKGSAVSAELFELGLSTDSKLEAMTALLATYPKDAIAIQKRYQDKFNKPLIVFRLITPLYFKGKNYVKRTLGEGKKIYNEVVEYAQQRGLNVQPIQMCDGCKAEKELFLENILNAGGEGVVFHNRKGEYCTSDNRSKTSFIKLKRSVSGAFQKTGMGDTIDGWISGFKTGNEDTGNEGMIASLEISIYLQIGSVKKQHVIAYVPNITKEMSQRITIKHEDGTVTMDEAMYDMVVECDGQAISRKSRRLTHPRLLRFRFDKLKEDCVYTEEFINSQIDLT